MSSPANAPISLAPDDAKSDARAEIARVEMSADTLEALAVDTPLLPPREPLGARLASYFGRHLILLFCVSFSCLWAILSLPSPFNRPDFAPGEVAPRDYTAPQNTFLPDRAETARRRAAAAALVTPAYDPAPSAQGQALFALHEISEKSRLAAAQLRLTPTKNRGSLVVLPPEKRFEARAGWKPAPQLLPTLRALQIGRWKLITGAAEDAVRAAYVQGRVRSDVGEDLVTLRALLRRLIANNSGVKSGAGAKEAAANSSGTISPDAALQNEISAAPLSAFEREIALDLAAAAAKFPNVVVNQKATDEARGRAANATLPVFLRVAANTPLLRQGERVSPEQFAQLQELELIAPRFRPLDALANGALCLLLVLGAAAYLARTRRDLVVRPAALWLVATIPTLFLGVFRLFLGVPHADFMMVPLAATAAMLLTVLIDARVGLPAGFVVAALCSLMARSEAGLFLAATLSAWIGALSVTQLASRFALLRSVTLLTISNAILAFSLGILREAPPEELLSSAAWSALAGAASVVAMAGLAIFIERPFGITSHLRLLELLAPDEVVIRRMQLEAPGTYTHSMTVAILAEAAAKSVGADPLLCRVAGLYHDIGKLRRPHCFIENQSGDNIHDRLSPGLSALLIKAHVKDGLELGRAIRLPAPILSVIASHHGTSLVAYFYHRARKIAAESGEEVSETTFRYSGPKPDSREAAIVMLADAIEASARSLPQITPETLQNHVHNLIATKVSEGELSECELSLKDLKVVRDAFSAVLRGVLHGRIAYPDPLELAGELSGAPVSASDNWVRQTLGEDDKRAAPRPPMRRADDHKERAADPQRLAAKSQKRQKKERRAKAAAQAATQISTETAPATDTNSGALEPKPRAENAVSGTKIDVSAPASEAVATDIVSKNCSPETKISAPSGARRRFKAPFHAPRNGTSTGKNHARNGANHTSDCVAPDAIANSNGAPNAGDSAQKIVSNGNSNGARFDSARTPPELEPRVAHPSARPENGAAPQKSRSNGAANDLANGAAALPNPAKPDSR